MMEAQPKSQLGDEAFEACVHNQRQRLEAWLEEHPDSDNLLPHLMTAAATRDAADVVTLCLEKGASVADPVVTTVASDGSFNSHKVLIEAKAVNANYFVPWFGDVLSMAATSVNVDWARFCLEHEHGADPNLNMVDDYKSVLAAATETGDVSMGELLLRHGACIQGSGAIVAVAGAGRTEMVRFLLAKGASVDEAGVKGYVGEESDKDMGNTLRKAIENGHDETALLLIASGADLQLEGGQGRTPRALAEMYKRKSVINSM